MEGDSFNFGNDTALPAVDPSEAQPPLQSQGNFGGDTSSMRFNLSLR